MQEVRLDGRNLPDRAALHAALKAALDFPGFYGNNLDALWDMITGHIALPVTVRWTYFARSQRLLGDYADLAYQLMKRAEKERIGFFVRKARYGQ